MIRIVINEDFYISWFWAQQRFGCSLIFGPNKGFDVRQKLWSVDGAPQLPLLFMWSSPLQCPALKIILTKTEDINPKCSSSSSADISASFRLLKSLLWKIWLLGIWLLRVVGFKESGLPILKIWYRQAVCQRDEINDKNLGRLWMIMIFETFSLAQFLVTAAMQRLQLFSGPCILI